MSRSAKTTNSVRLCQSLELRYSISVVSASKKKYKLGYFSSARFYLYSTSAKKKIGKYWVKAYPFTKEDFKQATSGKPKVYQIMNSDIREALTHLLNDNVDLPEYAFITKTKRPSQLPHNPNELLVYWLTHFSSIYALVTSAQTVNDVNSKMARIFMDPEIAGFDLSLLEDSKLDSLQSSCKSLVSMIKKTATKHNTVTAGLNKTVQLIRYTVKRYLFEKNIDSSQVEKLLLKESTLKYSTVSKVTNSMGLKSISIERYQTLWHLLSQSEKVEDIALLVMLFLSLTAEEVCALRADDCRPILDYRGYYQLRVTRKITVKKARKYNFEVLDEEHACRNVPLPFQLRKLIVPLKDAASDPSQFLFRNGDQPLKPDMLTNKLQTLLTNPENTITVRDKHNRQKTVDIAFQPSSYRQSCRHYWQYQCGLTEGEVCYLGALTPPDTASAHYIDFNNGSMQFRMLKQLEYGLALFATDHKNYKHYIDWVAASDKPFYSSGTLDTRADMVLRISEPVILSISSNRGIKIYKETDEDEV